MSAGPSGATAVAWYPATSEVVGQLEVERRRGLAQLGAAARPPGAAARSTSSTGAPRVAAGAGRHGVARRGRSPSRLVGPVDHLGPRVRVVVQPGARPGCGARRPRPTASGRRASRRLHDAGHRADVGADVAAAHLRATLDEHHAELAVAGQAVAHQAPVAGLEDVQGQDHPGHEDRAQREHGHHRHRPSVARRLTPPPGVSRGSGVEGGQVDLPRVPHQDLGQPVEADLRG